MDQRNYRRLETELSSTLMVSDVCLRGNFTELAYLAHFVQCYCPSMRIADWNQHPVYVMEDAGVKIGIAFCDLQPPFHWSSTQCEDNVMVYPNPDCDDITELWLVVVGKHSWGFNPQLIELVTRQDVLAIFDRILLFDFSESSIQIIQ
ncbi:hypothetical protein ACQ86K_12870 [Mucilaginibacter sp. P19]|uniref:Uncharacterized protein n=1 Tax=Mucilaginibacter gossypii TaxID=551996 RepID=A0A1G8D5P7_9SPHI|nr:hypothetical protein [Mucilaginibacter gossypii]SDH52873.1 hypothetical protein SAMN05192573_110127 [Mucilaginibacter gossypii]